MIHVSEVFDRVTDKVPALAGRLQGATDFARLVAEKKLPQNTPAAFVLHGALDGGKADLATGYFRQEMVESISIVLIVRSASDPTGMRAMEDMVPLVRAVVKGVAGWGPDDAPGVFTLGRGDLVGAEAGALIYQIDFRLNDQLRIIP